MSGFVYHIYHWIAQKIPLVIWSRYNAITLKQKDEIAHLLANDYYVILTGDNGTLSSWFVSFLTWIKTGKWSHYSHALMNCDFVTDPDDRDKFKFVEATAVGVHYSTFDHVFACDHVCLLSPRNMAVTEWTAVIDALLTYNGRPYDDLFDLVDSSRLSCVEVVVKSFQAMPAYENKFPELNAFLKNGNELLPQTFKDCGDFVVSYEVKNYD